MHHDDPECKLLAMIWEAEHRRPRPSQYRALAKGTSFPSVSDLVQKYGSFDNAVSAFLEAYHAINGYRHIPDYLLGALVSRAKVVHDKRNRTYLRFTSSDREQIDIIRSFMRLSAVYPAKKGKPTLYLRCYDEDFLFAFEHLCASGLPFRPTVDFVRGYIDTHSHFRVTTPGRYRLTITGPLVPQCHDFLVKLGARNTRVYSVGDSYRMNIHSGSLRKIRDALYPDGCVCNEKVRMMMYKA